MDTAYQLSNKNLLINVNYDSDITDICWPDKVNNLLLRGGVRTVVFDSLSLERLVLTPNLDKDSCEFFHMGDGFRLEMSIYISENKIIQRFSLDTPGIKLYVFPICTTDILENFSRDTVVHDPRLEGLVFYEQDVFLGVSANQKSLEFACHSPTDNHGKGAFPDENLQLSKNTVSNGIVQGALKYEVTSESDLEIHFSLAHNISMLHELAKITPTPPISDGIAIDERVNSLVEKLSIDSAYEDQIRRLLSRSKEVVGGSMTPSGGIFAAVDSSYMKKGGVDDYSYFWPRDGAIAIISGLEEELFTPDQLEKYFRYLLLCFGDKDFLWHRYTLTDPPHWGSSWYSWQDIDNPESLYLPIQIDETALNVIAYEKLTSKTGIRIQEVEEKLLAVCRYLEHSIGGDGQHLPSFDLWEHEWGMHTSTQISIIAALVSGRKLGFELDENILKSAENSLEKYFWSDEKEQFIRSIQVNQDKPNNTDTRFDSAFHWAWILEVLPLDDDRLIAHMEKMTKSLGNPNFPGGYARHERDFYLNQNDSGVSSNPWFISTLWFCQYYLRSGNLDAAKESLIWVLDHMEPTGILPEMANFYTGEGLSIRPLVWSHVEFLNLINLV